MSFNSYSRRLLTALSIAAVMTASLIVALPATARADYPDRPIHLLVPYPAGGPNDVIARLVGAKLSESLKQQVVIENRPGGSGNIAAVTTPPAEPDGYTIVLPAIAYAVIYSRGTWAGAAKAAR